MRNLLIAGLLGAALAGGAHAQPSAPPQLSFPLACQIGRNCEIQHYVDRDPGAGVADYRCGPRTYQAHSGIDIRALDMAQQRQGLDVLAAARGRVARLRDGVQDISIRAPGAPSVVGAECGNGVVIDHGGGWETQYCHLAKGSVKVKVGDQVTAGAPIARVGLSGDTEFPHLHFTTRHQGKVVDPFAPSAEAACKVRQTPLWTPAAVAAMPYKAGTILNAGFASGPVEMAQVEERAVPGFSAAAPILVVWVRSIGLQAGDVVELTLMGPGGEVLATTRRDPLVRSRAQDLVFVGRKRPPTGWAKGVYVGRYQVIRQGKAAVERRVQIGL